MDEFAIIRRYFTRLGPVTPEVQLGVGDDAALLKLQAGEQLVVSVDSAVVERHFFANTDPWAIGWRALAVALSDLAAMGARPIGFTLALTLPQVDEAWLQAFSQGLAAQAEASQCPLIGGDTTLGALNIGIQVLGAVANERAWQRRGAREGDLLAVTGPLGLARGGLISVQRDPARLQQRNDWNLLERSYLLPRPQLQEAARLMQGAAIHAAIDVSDGLLADLQHLLAASALGAELDLSRLPLHPELVSLLGEDEARAAALQGGDDYVLLISFADEDLPLVRNLCSEVFVLGRCVAGAGMRNEQGQLLKPAGYNHFPEP